MDINLIVTPIVGAVIGYCTNWIAIKMLFKPYTEKRILGLRVPFTPGLIPKERENIARSIGDVIENYLLTDEAIMDELASESMKEVVVKYIEDYIYDEEGQINVKKILSFLETDGQWIEEAIQKQIVGFATNTINDSDKKQKIVVGMTNQIVQALKDYKISDFKEEQELVNQQLKKAIGGEKVAGLVSKEIEEFMEDDKSLKELLPDTVCTLVNQSITFNTPTIINGIKTSLKNETLKEKLIEMISDTIQSKLGALGAMFANPTDLYVSIMAIAEEKLDDTENQEQIINFIIAKANELLDKEIYEIMPHNIKEEVGKTIASSLQEKAVEIDFLGLVKDDFNEKSLYEGLESMVENMNSKISGIVNNLYDQLANNDKLESTLKDVARQFMTKLINTKINISDENKMKIRGLVKDRYGKLVGSGVKQFTKDLQISKVVEKQLNAFDMVMLEDIILQIAKKELNGITRLGALLGFIMSLVILLFN